MHFTNASNEPFVFKLSDATFRLHPLRPMQSLRVLRSLQKSVIPLIGDLAKGLKFENSTVTIPEGLGDDFFRGLLGKALELTDLLPEIYEPFADRSEVLIGGAFQKVSTFDPFARNLPLMLGWILECLISEYSIFLAENGLEPIQQAGRKLISQIGSVGKSGT